MNIEGPFSALMSHGEIRRAIGARARKRRKQLKFSRQELAKRSGVSVATIGRFETSGAASMAVLIKLSHALGSWAGLEGLFSTSPYRSLDEFVTSSS